MKIWPRLDIVVLLLCAAAILLGQDTSAPYVLRFAKPKTEGTIQVPYYLSGAFPGVVSDRAEARTSALPDELSATILTRRNGADADYLLALIYQPGCQVEYLEIDDLKRAPSPGVTRCVPLETVPLHAIIQNIDEVGPTQLVAKIHYQAQLEHSFRGTKAIITVGFYIGPFPVAPDGSMSARLPDFDLDPVLKGRLSNGRWLISLLQVHHGPPLGLLVLPHGPTQPLRFLPVSSTYPDDVRLQFSKMNASTAN
jgi:hypothetical protein